ncbi:unnamed protein product [Linum trigynum]|uniref:F-box domain-containing protein n=1 Tax=Linum trigynum TaxID=586398 RepID=A0AAV2FF22_9ROSI
MKDQIPGDLITDILRMLPLSACIARFRCVSKLWRDLLCDPSFIQQNLSSSRSDDIIMLTNVDGEPSTVYSLLFPDTLEPLHHQQLLPFNPDRHHHPIVQVAGCCNGLFCIIDDKCENEGHDVILWNPATSETKVLPPSPFFYPHLFINAVGFGFDSEQNDFKIVRQLMNPLLRWWSCVLEVYSLKNNCWRKLDDDNAGGYHPQLPFWQISQFHRGKLYWRQSSKDVGGRGTLVFDSFDLVSQSFERVEVPHPSAKLGFYVSGYSFKEDSMLVVFPIYDHMLGADTSWEIWILLKCWRSESWIKLFVITTPPEMQFRFIGLTTNLKCFFVATTRRSYKGFNYDGDDSCFLVFHPDTGRIGRDLKVMWDEVISYRPSQISLQDY